MFQRYSPYTDQYFFNYLNRKPQPLIMKTYILQFGTPKPIPDTPSGVPREEPRLFIDEHLHAGNEQLSTTQAESWPQAREAFWAQGAPV